MNIRSMCLELLRFATGPGVATRKPETGLNSEMLNRQWIFLKTGPQKNLHRLLHLAQMAREPVQQKPVVTLQARHLQPQLLSVPTLTNHHKLSLVPMIPFWTSPTKLE